MPATATQSDGVLAKIDRAASFLAEAKTLQETNAVLAMAEAAAVFAKRVNASKTTIAHAQEIQLRAERKLGEILAATPKATGGDRAGRAPKLGGSRKEPPIAPPPTLEEIGIDKKLSSRAQRLAKVPEPVFEQTLVTARENDISPTQVHEQIARVIDPKPIARRPAHPQERWSKLVTDLYMLSNSIRDIGGIDKLVAGWAPGELQDFANEFRKFNGEIGAWIKILENQCQRKNHK